MNKSIAYIILILSACLILLFVYTLYHEEFSETAIAGKKNVQNFQKVEVGMDSLTVLAIMSNPIERYVVKENIYYNYEVPLGSSFQCQVVLNKKGKVTFKSGEPSLGEN